MRLSTLDVLLWALRSIIPPALLALIIIVQLNPLVEWLHRRSLPRLAASIVAYVGAAPDGSTEEESAAAAEGPAGVERRIMVTLPSP